MMFKKLKPLLLIVLILTSLLYKINVKAAESKTLLIYDSYNEFGSGENKLNSLVREILNVGSGMDIINVNSFNKGLLSQYQTVYILYNNPSKVSSDFSQSLLNFKGKIIWIGKNFVPALKNQKNVSYFLDFSEEAAISDGEQLNKPKVYLLIDEVYPIIDIQGFIDKINFLYNQGIPFICSVMPVYENQDFDAMKRFCDVLRYAQSKGGKIILHSSVITDPSASGKVVQDKMGLAQSIYIKYGVYPLAIDVPDSFLYKEDYKSLVHSSSNIFIERDKDIGIIDFQKYSLQGFNNVINKLQVYSNYNYKPSQIVYNTAFSINADLDISTFKSKVENIINNGIYFNDPEYLDSDITLGGIDIKSKNDDVFLNDKLVNEKGNSPKRNSNTKTEAVDISSENKSITKATIVICGLFLIIVLISVRIERRKFFK